MGNRGTGGGRRQRTRSLRVSAAARRNLFKAQTVNIGVRGRRFPNRHRGLRRVF